MQETNAHTTGAAHRERHPEAPAGDLWLDRFARRLGFGRIANVIGLDLPPSYVYAVTTIVGWLVVSVSYDLLHGATLIYETNPYFILQPVVLLGAVYGSRTLHRSYERVTREMRIEDRASQPERLISIVPDRLPWFLFVAVAGAQLARAYLDFAAFNTTGIVANVIVFPFVYAPILVQFCAVYVAIEFIAPWRLMRSDVGIHFLDPHGVGGLRPLGELIKRAYYFIVAGLIAYALITYAPFVSSDWEVSAAAGVIFTIAWVVSIATVAFAVFTLHRFMHREKREELQRLEAELRSHVENPWDVKAYGPVEGKEDLVADLRRRIDTVSATSEYPATFSIWSQLLLSVVVPKAVQLLLAGA